MAGSVYPTKMKIMIHNQHSNALYKCGMTRGTADGGVVFIPLKTQESDDLRRKK